MENTRTQRFLGNLRNPPWLWASPITPANNISAETQQKRWYHVQCARTALAVTGVLWLYHQVILSSRRIKNIPTVTAYSRSLCSGRPTTVATNPFWKSQMVCTCTFPPNNLT